MLGTCYCGEPEVLERHIGIPRAGLCSDYSEVSTYREDPRSVNKSMQKAFFTQKHNINHFRKEKKFPKNLSFIRKLDVLTDHHYSPSLACQWDRKFKKGDLSQALETCGTSERGIKSLSVAEKI